MLERKPNWEYDAEGQAGPGALLRAAREKDNLTVADVASNLRINELTKRYDEFGEDFQMVAIFDSPIENLKKYTNKHDAPFWILADEKNTYFNKYSIEKSFLKFLKGTTIRFHRLLFAMMKGYIPSMIPRGSFSTIPVDILIGKDGVVEEVYYAKDTSDHLSFDTVKEFSKN